MDTTQKNPEQTAQRRPRPAQQSGERKSRPVQNEDEKRKTSAPRQNTGAVKTQQAPGKQRPAKAKAAPAKEKPAAPKRRKAPEKEAAPKKKTPLKKEAPAKKRPAPKPETEDLSGKKRAYGNSKPKKSAFRAVNEILHKKPEEKNEKKKKNRPKQPTPAVIYTQPQAFNRNRLLIQLATALAVVAALVFGLSVFFKVEHITVSGAEVYDPYTVKQYSGIKEGDNLLTFSRPRAGALIKANLAYVDTVRFGIKLPGTVNIIIEEDDVVYAIKDQNEAWWLMNSDGRIVEQASGSRASSHTQVLGVKLENPVPDTFGVAVEVVPTETIAGGELAPVTESNAMRLKAALQILQALEANDIVGSAASVDVTRLEDIILWYGTRYQVNLGDSARLEYKIACMNDVILQMSEYQSGILDISFTIWPNQVGYTPFA